MKMMITPEKGNLVMMEEMEFLHVEEGEIPEMMEEMIQDGTMETLGEISGITQETNV